MFNFMMKNFINVLLSMYLSLIFLLFLFINKEIDFLSSKLSLINNNSSIFLSGLFSAENTACFP